jgi:tetrahydromethanopterin S-methyltransferase subunit F
VGDHIPDRVGLLCDGRDDWLLSELDASRIHRLFVAFLWPLVLLVLFTYFGAISIVASGEG